MRALVFFGRFPRSGRCKTRLGRALADFDASAAIYRELVALALARSRDLGDVAFACADASDVASCREMMEDIARECALTTVPNVLEQTQSSDLGERMVRAMEERYASGAKACVVVGTDVPDFTSAIALEAFALIERESVNDAGDDVTCDVAFGRARDGGFYCVGARSEACAALRSAFANVRWSARDTLERCVENCRRLGLRTNVQTLPELIDVDDVEDLDAWFASAKADDEERARVRRCEDIARACRARLRVEMTRKDAAPDVNAS